MEATKVRKPRAKKVVEPKPVPVPVPEPEPIIVPVVEPVPEPVDDSIVKKTRIRHDKMKDQVYDPFASKEISPKSKKLYMYNLFSLNGDVPFKNLAFLSNYDEILEKLKSKPVTTRRSYYIAIVSALKCDTTPKSKKLYVKYYPLLEEINKELKSMTDMPTDKENWLSLDELKAKQVELAESVPDDKLKKLMPASYQAYMDYVVLSLYTLQAPRRNLDYIQMKFENSPNGDSNPDINYYYSNKFVFNNYKTKGTYSSQIIIVSPELKAVLDKFRKYVKDPNGMLLQYYDGSNVTSSPELTKMLNRILGRKVGCSKIRASYATAKHSKAIADIAQSATEMGTSSNMIANVYSKQPA
jgi:hypothetical protein